MRKPLDGGWGGGWGGGVFLVGGEGGGGWGGGGGVLGVASLDWVFGNGIELSPFGGWWELNACNSGRPEKKGGL